MTPTNHPLWFPVRESPSDSLPTPGLRHSLISTSKHVVSNNLGGQRHANRGIGILKHGDPNVWLKPQTASEQLGDGFLFSGHPVLAGSKGKPQGHSPFCPPFA